MKRFPFCAMTDTSASEIARSVKSGERSAVEIAGAALDEIRKQAPLNCFTDVTEDRALAEAAAIDARRARGETLPPLAGVPYAVKNLFDVSGVTTLAGSKMRREEAAASRDATVVERMAAAGGVLVGTTNMDEFAFGFTTENSHYGPTRNPHDTTRIAGGSSGGSAAAVGAELVPIALGSDTNGSIRVPASLCGVFGLKPTYGRLSRRGTFPFVASLDHVGVFSRSVLDLTTAYDALQGPDAGDPVCAQRKVEPCTPALSQGGRALRVGRLTGYFDENAGAEALAARDRALQAFDNVRDVGLPSVNEARSAAVIITAAEGASLHLPNLIARPFEFDVNVRDRLLAGALIPAAWVISAQRFRRWFANQMFEIFKTFDVLVTAATPWPATLIGQREDDIHGHTVNVLRSLGAMTMPFSFIGIPAMVAPAPTAGLPVGVQLVAAPWREDLLLRAASELELMGASS